MDQSGMIHAAQMGMGQTWYQWTQTFGHVQLPSGKLT